MCYSHSTGRNAGAVNGRDHRLPVQCHYGTTRPCGRTDDLARNEYLCNGRSAYICPDAASPKRYVTDASSEDTAAFRVHHSPPCPAVKGERRRAASTHAETEGDRRMTYSAE